MLEQYPLIALVIAIIWLVGFAIYLLVSRRQARLESDIKVVDELLENDGRD